MKALKDKEREAKNIELTKSDVEKKKKCEASSKEGRSKNHDDPAPSGSSKQKKKVVTQRKKKAISVSSQEEEEENSSQEQSEENVFGQNSPDVGANDIQYNRKAIKGAPTANPSSLKVLLPTRMSPRSKVPIGDREKTATPLTQKN